MLLLVDAGNTRIKWALADSRAEPGHWREHGALAHAELELLADRWKDSGIASALVSNVGGAALGARLAAVLPAVPVEWFASAPSRAGLRNRYRDPRQLGCDRFAAAIGARALFPGQPLVVATCGTATTVDAVDADGSFVGGMILPGLALMAAALSRNTAQLPEVATDRAAPPLFADNTDEAIRSGCLSAQAGAIERACHAHSARVCIVSGGAAPAVAPVLGVAHTVVENIVLVGLHAAALAPATMEETSC